MATRLPALLLLAPLAATGCRIVWVHPKGDAERFGADRGACEIQASEPMEGRWRDCMAARGWSPTVGYRWEEPFARE